MVSTPTTRLRLNKQATGDNVNTWGSTLNAQAFDLLDEAVAGVETIALTGNHTLTSTNYVPDQARNLVLRFTGSLGSGATITIPSIEKAYFVINDAGQTLTFSAGGVTGLVPNGRRKWIACDGTDVYVSEDGADKEYVDAEISAVNAALVASIATKLNLTGGTLTGALSTNSNITMTGGILTLAQAPTSNLHASTKKYVDDTAFASLSGVLPAQAGNAGNFLTTNGTVAGWLDATTVLQPLDSDLTAIAALSTTGYGRSYLTRANPISIDHTASPYTAAYGQTLLVNSSGGAVTINLPAAVAGGSSIVVIDVGGAANTNNITLDPNGAETISGEATVEIDQDYKGLTLYALAGSWGFKG
jgi:hypothetical protein